MTNLRRFAVVLAITLVLGPFLSVHGEVGHPISQPVEPQFVEKLATGDTLAKLRVGGFVLFLRHGATNTTVPDRLPDVDFMDCSTQRPLTDEGRRMSAQVGQFIRQAGIPIGDILTSPLCRAKESAFAAFPNRAVLIESELIYTANLSSRQKKKNVDYLKKILSTPVPEATNRLVVAHAPNLMDVMGYFPNESTLVIIRPLGDGGFEYVASVTTGLWFALLR